MPPGIYHLPLELVRGVAAESGSRDLAALALTCRHFHAWVNPCLYEHNLKQENADAAVWAAAHGRLDTLLLLHGSESRLSKPFIKKVWCGRARYGKFLPIPQPAGSPLKFTLLHLAAQGGHDDVVSWLLQRGADVDAYSEHLCECNVSSLEPSAWTPLHLALCNSHEETVKLLLARNASLQTDKDDEIEALHTAASMGLISTIRHLSTLPGFCPNVEDSGFETPLHYAIRESKSPDTVKTLLDVGANVQGAGDDRLADTPLWHAAARGDLEMAVMLLEAGAKPFTLSDNLRKKTAPYKQQIRRRQRFFHMSLLHVTLSEKETTGNSGRHGALQRKIIRALLDFGCDVNDDLSGSLGYSSTTPLVLAVRNSSSATVRLLLERGAEVNADDGYSSALFYALSERASSSLADRADKVTALLEHGANLLQYGILDELITRRSSRTVVDAVADNLGPKNLTGPIGISRALAICCIFQERKMYDSIKRYAQVNARATDEDIRYALARAAHSKRACVPAFLDEMRPGLTVQGVLDQWRGKMVSYSVEWLEEIKGLESSEGKAPGSRDRES